MKIQKSKALFCAFLISSVFFKAFSDDFQDFADFSDFSDFENSAESQSNFSINGKASIETRAYIDCDSAEEIAVSALPQGELSFSYNGKKADGKISLKLNEEIIKNHPIDIIDELEIKGYFDFFSIEAGKMKTVWGKGDKYHVLDNFNADDYSDFIIPDYIERRISTPMIKLNFDIPVSNLHIEALYAPILTTDHFASSGRWVPSQIQALNELVTNAAENSVAIAFKKYNQALLSYDSKNLLSQASLLKEGKAYLTALNAANDLKSNPSSIYPDLMTLKYSQFGGRLTGTFGSFDLGLSYYNGFYKQPTVNYDKIGTYIQKRLSESATEEDKFLSFDRKQTFGFEAATVLWRLNLRGEFAYNLTEDTAGTNPSVRNNSLGYLLGFDIDLPFWNMNLNVQETGNVILNSDKIEDNANDFEKSKTGYTSNKIIANITTSFFHDKLVPEVTAIWSIERKDFILLPKISFKATDALTFEAKGMYILSGDENSEFYAWRKNSFVSIYASCQF